MIDRWKQDVVHVLRIDRPPVNAIDLELVEHFTAELDATLRDPACAALVVSGRAGVFSAGIDTKAVPAYSPEQRARMLRAVNRLVLTVYAAPKPVVAAISGHALGGGFVIALACDARIAADNDARIGLTEARAGIPFPAAPLEVIRAELAPERLRALALGAGEYAPRDPELAGLLDAIVPENELIDACAERARALAAMPAFVAVKLQVRAPTIATLRRIVDEDDDPLLASWL